MNYINTEEMKELLLFMADELIKSKPLLTEIDSRIGDGDHGIGMATGFSAVQVALEHGSFENINQLFRQAGMAMLHSMGGASGVLFSSIFLEAVKGMEEIKSISTGNFSKMMRKGLDEVKRRGGAELGDKTMVDALQPACEAMEGYQGESFEELLQNAYDAAAQGVEDTKTYMAKFGRAKFLMERAIGFQDAGATSVMLMFRAAFAWSKKEKR